MVFFPQVMAASDRGVLTRFIAGALHGLGVDVWAECHPIC